jgi:hypothetical protein
MKYQQPNFGLNPETRSSEPTSLDEYDNLLDGKKELMDQSNVPYFWDMLA